MLRHEYTPPGWPSHCSFVIGWDDALGTFFGLVIDSVIGRGEAGVIATFGGEPPHFSDLDNLMRVVNGRIRDRLPPVHLARELRRELMKHANANSPVVNTITLSDPGKRAPASEPLTRPCRALGTCSGYLDSDELKEVMDGMADQFFRLERLYQARKAAGLNEANDEDTKLIRKSLGSMEAVCHILAGMVRAADILVAIEALQPFYALSAEAARVLQGESASETAPAETVH